MCLDILTPLTFIQILEIANALKVACYAFFKSLFFILQSFGEALYNYFILKENPLRLQKTTYLIVQKDSF